MQSKALACVLLCLVLVQSTAATWVYFNSVQPWLFTWDFKGGYHYRQDPLAFVEVNGQTYSLNITSAGGYIHTGYVNLTVGSHQYRYGRIINRTLPIQWEFSTPRRSLEVDGLSATMQTINEVWGVPQQTFDFKRLNQMEPVPRARGAEKLYVPNKQTGLLDDNQIAAAFWSWDRNPPVTQEWVAANLTIITANSSKVLTNVGVRVGGNRMRRLDVNFVLDTNKFNPGQTLWNREKLYFRLCIGGRTPERFSLREKLVEDLSTGLGYLGRPVSFIRLWVNGGDLYDADEWKPRPIYIVTERIDKDFVRRIWGSQKNRATGKQMVGNLYEGKNGTITSGDFMKYGADFAFDVKENYTAVMGPPFEDINKWSKIIFGLKNPNEAGAPSAADQFALVDSIMDVDGFLQACVIGETVMNMDSHWYKFIKQSNYYLHRDVFSRKFHLILWDDEESFVTGEFNATLFGFARLDMTAQKLVASNWFPEVHTQYLNLLKRFLTEVYLINDVIDYVNMFIYQQCQVMPLNEVDQQSIFELETYIVQNKNTLAAAVGVPTEVHTKRLARSCDQLSPLPRAHYAMPVPPIPPEGIPVVTVPPTVFSSSAVHVSSSLPVSSSAPASSSASPNSISPSKASVSSRQAAASSSASASTAPPAPAVSSSSASGDKAEKSSTSSHTAVVAVAVAVSVVAVMGVAALVLVLVKRRRAASLDMDGKHVMLSGGEEKRGGPVTEMAARRV